MRKFLESAVFALFVLFCACVPELPAKAPERPAK